MSLSQAGPGRVSLCAMALAGVIAAAILWIGIPVHDAGLKNPALRRDAYIARARAAATGLGVDAANWRAQVALRNERRPENRLVESGRSQSPLERPQRSVRVVLIRPERSTTLPNRAELRLAEDGRLLEWRLPHGEDDGLPAAQDSDPKPQQLADAAVHEMAGPYAELFQASKDSTAPNNGTHQLTAKDPRIAGLNWQLELEFSNGRLAQAKLEPDLADWSFFRGLRWRLRPADLRAFGFILFVVLGIGATLAGIGAWRRGVLDRRLLLVAIALMLVLSLPAWRYGTHAEEIAGEFAQDNDIASAVFKELVAIGWGALVLAAAEARAQRRDTAPWASLRMALAGRWINEYVMRGLAAGLAAGAVVALCRVAPVLLGFSEPLWRALGESSLSPSPLSDALGAYGDAEILAVPLFALAWCTGIGNRGMRTILLWLCVVVLALAQGHTETSVITLVLASVAVAAVTIFTYLDSGALAVAVALPASHVWLAVCGTQNGKALAGIAALGVAAWLWGIRSDDPVAEQWLPLEVEDDAPSTRREQLKAEFTDAREAQQRLLPSHPPELPAYDIAAVCLPATDVGGDLYDFHTLPGGRVMFSVADVSGKGMPAALFMTLSKGALAAICEETGDLSLIAELCNRHIYAAGGRGTAQRKVFVTAALAALEPASGEIEIARAGHNPPLLLRASGAAEYLMPAGLAFGLVPTGVFRPRLKLQSLRLEPGDTLILYSDGITEAMNLDEEQFEEGRLMDVCRQPGDSAELCARIVAAVQSFAGAAPQHDDMTIVVLKRKF